MFQQEQKCFSKNRNLQFVVFLFTTGLERKGWKLWSMTILIIKTIVIEIFQIILALFYCKVSCVANRIRKTGKFAQDDI